MNNYEEVYTLIESINNKIKAIDKILNQIENIRNLMSRSEKYNITLDNIYNESTQQLTNCIERISKLNNIITNELLAEYEHIFKELNSKCIDVIQELKASMNTINSRSTLIEE